MSAVKIEAGHRLLGGPLRPATPCGGSSPGHAAATWTGPGRTVRGASTIEAVLFDHDAATLDKRLDMMARGVCDADPRTLDQRRADAFGAFAAGAERLACACGTSRLPRGGKAGQCGGDQCDRRREESVRRHHRGTGWRSNPDRPTKPVREMTVG